MRGAAVGLTLSALFLIWLLIRNPFLVDSLGLSLLLFVVLPAATFGILGVLIGVVVRGRSGTGKLARRWLIAGLVVAVAACAVGRGVAATSARGRATPGLKLLLIGMDGATWRVAGPMMERGALPNLTAAAASGASGVLMSTSPMFSPRIFTTIASGKVADKHGVQGPSDTTTDSVLVKRIWDILWEQKGWDYGLVEWYVTGPPEASPDGFCIPGPPAIAPETVPPAGAGRCLSRCDGIETRGTRGRRPHEGTRSLGARGVSPRARRHRWTDDRRGALATETRRRRGTGGYLPVD
jgi:hypothetical protein